MEHAAQAAVLEPPESEIRTAMRAVAVEQSEPARVVAEQHAILAQQAHRLDRAPPGQFLGEGRRLPVLPHELPTRRARADAGDQGVLLRTHHGGDLQAHNPPGVAAIGRKD